MMFLKTIANETPEATAALFELRDPGQWMDRYRLSADWLDVFLRATLEKGKSHFDWIGEHPRLFNNQDETRRDWSVNAWLRMLADFTTSHAIAAGSWDKNIIRLREGEPWQ
jgi:hypothetical protein